MIKFKRLHPTAILPEYATPGSAAMDFYVAGDKAHHLYTGSSVIVRTGLAVEVPEGYMLDMRSRSGHGFAYAIRLANCTGVIDSDYRGELLIKLTRDRRETKAAHRVTINPGDRVAQGIVLPAPQFVIGWVDQLSDTARGRGGFGSTGR